MLELTPDNVIPYLQQRGDLEVAESSRAALLGWGVSNVVLRISSPGGEDLVIKQSRETLRTAAEWRSRLDRVFREADVMRAICDVVAPEIVPRVLFEDRDNYLFAMQAVEADHVVWKAALLDGEADPHVALLAADCLATIHGRTTGNLEMKRRWRDATVFDELRLDPFYRFTAGRVAETREFYDELVRETLATSSCLVLGDFSPKNILLTSRGISLVDFETACFGDPAFDVGFFLSHLLLKTLRHAERRDAFLHLTRAFWAAYLDRLVPAVDDESLHRPNLSRRSTRHLAGCLLARIDGKSPVDYLDESQRDFTRGFAMHLIADPPDSPDEVFRLLGDALC
ncbi:MAG: phosphotransferase [Planctomycetaceae bacterium]